MERFNWIWKTLRTLSVVMCGVCLPSTAFALGLGGTYTLPPDRSHTLGLCSIQTVLFYFSTYATTPKQGSARVSVNVSAFDPEYAHHHAKGAQRLPDPIETFHVVLQ